VVEIGGWASSGENSAASRRISNATPSGLEISKRASAARNSVVSSAS
jgi:hypothetical protein